MRRLCRLLCLLACLSSPLLLSAQRTKPRPPRAGLCQDHILTLGGRDLLVRVDTIYNSTVYFSIPPDVPYKDRALRYDSILNVVPGNYLTSAMLRHHTEIPSKKAERDSVRRTDPKSRARFELVVLPGVGALLGSSDALGPGVSQWDHDVSRLRFELGFRLAVTSRRKGLGGYVIYTTREAAGSISPPAAQAVVTGDASYNSWAVGLALNRGVGKGLGYVNFNAGAGICHAHRSLTDHGGGYDTQSQIGADLPFLDLMAGIHARIARSLYIGAELGAQLGAGHVHADVTVTDDFGDTLASYSTNIPFYVSRLSGLISFSIFL